MGVYDRVTVPKVSVFVDTHACEADSAAERRNVAPSQNDTCEIVSLVPPFVYVPDVATVIDPAEGAFHVMVRFVASPADAAVVPAAPGSAV